MHLFSSLSIDLFNKAQVVTDQCIGGKESIRSTLEINFPTEGVDISTLETLF